MAIPTQSIFPIENGKLTTSLDCNNLQMLNLDTSNLGLGGGGSGNDTGTTVAILKGDGNHGFADAVADTDYATPASVVLKEDITVHEADLLAVTNDIDDLTDALTALTTEVGTKADDSDLTDGLALKVDQTAYDTAIASLTTSIGNKADSSAMSTALAAKADTSVVTAALANKEPLLPTTANDAYILARHNAGAGSAWYFVDPVTLGTTSQTFTDGQSFTNTNYDSATAVFVAGDVGLTITGTNIPSGTTIASRTSATRVVLSQATTGTGGPGLTFTIVNRLLTTNAGTVTTVGVTNNATGLFSTSVTNATTTPQITIDPSTSVGANTFYGNGTAFSGAAGFMSAAVARTALGGTTVGQALFQLANPTAISYPRINADNTVTTRTPAQTLTDLGAESALTFSSPLSRATNTISISAVSAIQNGYLTSGDYSIFSAKAPSTRTISTTAPLTGGGDLSVNRTIAMPAATFDTDGYLSIAVFNTFNSKPPSSRTISTTAPLTGGGDLSANRTIAMPAASISVDGYLRAVDFAGFASGSNIAVLAGQGSPTGTLTISPSANPPVNRIILNAVLAQPLNVILPPALNYSAALGYPEIEFIDIIGGAAANFAITVTRSGSDTIDGTTSITLAKGSAYQRFNSNGNNKWSSTKYFVDSFKDASDPTKQARISFSAGFPTATTRLVSPASAGDSVTVVPFAAVSGQVVRSIGGDGQVTASPVALNEVVPNEIVVDDLDEVITDSTTDTIKVGTALTATRLFTLPNVVSYSAGEVLRVYDSTGNPNNQIARFKAIASNSLNGAAGGTVDINDGAGRYFHRVFVADPNSANWSAETLPGTTSSSLNLDPWHIVTAGATTTITCSSNVIENHHIVNMSGATTLVMSGATEGQTGRIKFRDSTGNHIVTVPNNIAKTPNAGGVGLFTTTTGTNVEDVYAWDLDSAKFNFYPLGLNMVAAAPPSFATIADDTTTGQSTTTSVAAGSSTNFRYVASRLVANNNGITTGATYTIGKVSLQLAKLGTPVWDLFVSIWSDTGLGVPNVQIDSESALVTAASLATGTATTGETTVDFSPTATGIIGPRAETGVTIANGSLNIIKASGFLQSDVGCLITGTGIQANTKIDSVAGDGGSAMMSLPATGAGSQTLTIKHVYWIVLRNSNFADNSNNVRWYFHDGPTAGRTILYRKSLAGTWTLISSTNQAKYITYKQ